MAGNIKLEVTKIRSCSHSSKINKMKPLSKLKYRNWQYLPFLFAVVGNVDISLESSCSWSCLLLAYFYQYPPKKSKITVKQHISQMKCMATSLFSYSTKLQLWCLSPDANRK